jgi:chromosome segregation ATPase
MKQLALSLCVAGSILMLACLASAQSNKQSGDAQTLQALLTEVRQLRLALQKSNLIAYRSQITVERMRSARGRIDLLTGKLEQIRNEIAEMDLQFPQAAERIKQVEGVSDELGAEQRKAMEWQITELKSQLDNSKKRQSQLRDRETQLTQQLNSEKAQLDDLDRRMEMLDRELESEMRKDQAPEKTTQDEKRP